MAVTSWKLLLADRQGFTKYRMGDRSLWPSSHSVTSHLHHTQSLKKSREARSTNGPQSDVPSRLRESTLDNDQLNLNASLSCLRISCAMRNKLLSHLLQPSLLRGAENPDQEDGRAAQAQVTAQRTSPTNNRRDLR